MPTAVCLGVVAALAASAPAAEADPDGGLYALTLANAVEGDKPLHLYLTRRAGTFTGAWAAALARKETDNLAEDCATAIEEAIAAMKGQ